MLNNYEQILFCDTSQNELAILPKTQTVGNDFSSTVLLDGMRVDLPKPYVYTLSPLPAYHGNLSREEVYHNIILYDNAGEHIDPQNDDIGNPATKHLIQSDGIFFLFDPTKDAGMRRQCDSSDPQTLSSNKVYDQSTTITEMISRIRRHGNLKANESSSTPLVVLVAKYDTWRKQFDYDLNSLSRLKEGQETFSSVLDLDAVMNISFHTRRLLLKNVPRIVSSAEAFFESVVYLPVSVFGRVAERNEQGTGIRPSDVSPIWLDVPILYLLHQLGFISGTGRDSTVQALPGCRVIHDVIHFQVPGSGERVQLPLTYADTVIEIGGHSYLMPQRSPGNSKLGRRVKRKSGPGNFWE